MMKKGYANGNIGLRLTHLKARVNELIKSGILKSEIEGKHMNLRKDMLLLSFYLCGINLRSIDCEFIRRYSLF